MIKFKLYIILPVVFFTSGTIWSQTSRTFQLTEPVKTELNRLNEAYQILDQFATDVWIGWDDYMNFPFLFTFQNGLRILVGHPAPPREFVPYPDFKVHGLELSVDTTKMNNFVVKKPLQVGGGPLPLGSFNNKPVTVVDIRVVSPTDLNSGTPDVSSGENSILVFIHELMHCYQSKILKRQYGNLNINPDLNIALYSDIEGQALLKAYEQTSVNETLPFLKDFCVARSFRLKSLTHSEISSSECDEFREGEAVYSEVRILTSIKKGFKSSLLNADDKDYSQFADPDALLKKYPDRLRNSTGNTLDIYGKNYWYGCFEALLLQRYFPGWQKEIEKEVWLDQIIRERINLTSEDSLNSLRRFRDIYHIDSLKSKHGAVISGRDETYKMFQQRKGKAYIIDFKPITPYLSSMVDKSLKHFELGLIYMYPDGIKELNFDAVSISFKHIPTEIDELYFVKMVDTSPGRNKKSYKIKYDSKDNNGYYYNVLVTTPLFTIKAPKISIRESSNRVKFIIHSRT